MVVAALVFDLDVAVMVVVAARAARVVTEILLNIACEEHHVESPSRYYSTSFDGVKGLRTFLMNVRRGYQCKMLAACFSTKRNAKILEMPAYAAPRESGVTAGVRFVGKK